MLHISPDLAGTWSYRPTSSRIWVESEAGSESTFSFTIPEHAATVEGG